MGLIFRVRESLDNDMITKDFFYHRCKMKTEIIKAKFQFLLDEYGYSVQRELYSPEVMGNALVVFVSSTTGMMVVVDRDQVLVNIGDVSRPEKEWYEFSHVVHFRAPTLKEVYYFQKNLPDHHDLEPQLDWIVHLLREYCEPVLRGDFSNVRRLKKEVRRSAVN